MKGINEPYTEGRGILEYLDVAGAHRCTVLLPSPNGVGPAERHEVQAQHGRTDAENLSMQLRNAQPVSIPRPAISRATTGHVLESILTKAHYSCYVPGYLRGGGGLLDRGQLFAARRQDTV